MSTINIFNKNVFQFLDDLDKIISIDYYSKLISQKKVYIERVLLLKNDILIELFKKSIFIYKDNILKHDTSILSNINKLELFEGLNIEELLNHMSDENKNIFWNYLKAFILLCEKHYFTL